MKCPAILKGKKPCGASLLTQRTLANGRTVTRERHCPKCKSRFYTIEQFQEDIKKVEQVHTDQILKLEYERDKFQEHFEGCKELLRTLGQAIKEASKK